MAFGPRVRLAPTSYDGRLRLCRPDWGLLTSVATGLPKGFGLAFNSVDGRLAVGFHDEPVLRLYNGATLTARDTTGIANGNLMSVAWRATGDTLYAGGLYHDGAGRPLLAWGHGGTAPRRVCGRATTP